MAIWGSPFSCFGTIKGTGFQRALAEATDRVDNMDSLSAGGAGMVLADNGRIGP